MTTPVPKPTIPDMVSLRIQALAKIAEMPAYEGSPGNAFQELLDRDAVVKQIHVLHEALIGISAEHGRQLTQRAAQDESFLEFFPFPHRPCSRQGRWGQS